MWDLWVVSAADEKQKLIFEKQIDILIKKGRLPKGFKYLIIADPEGIKAGSGGATIHIYRKLKDLYSNELQKKKIIVIHAGGFSKRLPVYSIKGKLFSNIKQNGEPQKLFEFFVSNYESLSNNIASGMLIVPGDIQIAFNENMELKKGIVYGISAKADINTATMHGVYIAGADRVLIKFLHKKDSVTLKQYADGNIMVDADTGILLMPFEILDKLSKTLGPIKEPLNLYNDFITPLSKEITKKEYIESGVDDGNSGEIIKYRKQIFKLLKNDSLQVIKLNVKFTHIGTSGEYINTLAEDTGIFIENSIIKKLKHSGNLVIEDSMLMGENYIGKGCMIQSVITKQSITLQAGYILSQVPVKIDGVNGFATLKYPVKTNAKTTEGFQWSDKCFWFMKNRDDSLNAALSDDKESNCSFADCYKYCDINKIISESNEIDDRIKAIDKLEKDTDLHFDKRLLQEAILDTTGIKLPHVYRFLSESEGDPFYKKAFNKISELVCLGSKTEISQETQVINQSVKVLSAARINIGGGWTDTPPYCYENGGKVINMSVLPENKYPIEVEINAREDKKIKFECKDTNISVLIESIKDLNNEEMNENFLIHKNVCLATGIISDSYLRGLNISTFSSLPAGSGLGTSSIMVNACLQGIFKTFNFTYDKDYIINKTLQIEQMMGCGGGWQDQAGVLWPGIKIIETQPGLPQKYNCITYNSRGNFISELNKKMVLIYSGKRRMAKNILHKVVSNYLLYKNETSKIYNKIIGATEELDEILKSGSIEDLTNIISKSIKLNMQLDSGCSNDAIENIIDMIKMYSQDYTICGAGGGGYILVILKDGFTHTDIANELYSKNDFTDIEVLQCFLTDEPIIIFD